MEMTVYSNNKGFTLAELLVAMVIMMVGLLGLLQTVNYAINHNMSNQLRQEAAILADNRMNQEKIKAFDHISSPLVTPFTVRRVVNGAFRNYSVVKTNSDLTLQTKNIDIQVLWRYKNERFNHSISSLVSKFQ
jgi:type IV pilus assembly protein PilV